MEKRISIEGFSDICVRYDEGLKQFSFTLGEFDAFPRIVLKEKAVRRIFDFMAGVLNG